MRPGDVLLGSHVRMLRALVPSLARLHLRLVLLLPLHPPVLEPDLYLSLSQAEGVSNLNSEKMINDIRTMPARLK